MERPGAYGDYTISALKVAPLTASAKTIASVF